MKRRFLFFLPVVFLVLCQITTSLGAEEEIKPAFPKGKVSGYAFGDYFYNLQNSDSTKNDFNAFQFRRIYSYYDYEWSEKFAAQFLLEADGKEATSGGKIGVFVKSAYLEWKELVPMASLYIGMSATPTWSTHSEKVWAYRPIEKTILDLRGLGVASDLGLGLKGKFNKEGTVFYHVMVGDGTGQKPEKDKYKKFFGYVVVKPVKELALEGYGDYEGAAHDKSKITLKGFAAYQKENFTLGVEGFQRTNKKARTVIAIGTIDARIDTSISSYYDVVPFGVTIFAHATLIKDQLRGFARYDFYDPDTKVDTLRAIAKN